jgi:uncharacterized membrane protein
MIAKAKALWSLMQAGKVVKDPAKWKARQITSSVIVGFLWTAISTAEAFGINVPVNAEIVDGFAVALLGIINFVLTITTTDKIGLHSEPEAADK